MKGIKFGVDWIAVNDEPESTDLEGPDAVSGFISVLLLADLFEKEPIDIAKRVIKRRKELKRKGEL